MKLDIIIPNYRGRDLLERFLPGVLESLPEARVTVIDDGGNDGSVEMLEQRFPQVRLIARETNGGFSIAVNAGINASDGDLVLLLNNDVQVGDNILEHIIPLFEDQSVFAVTPRILLPARDNLDEAAKTGFWYHGMFFVDQRQGVSSLVPVLYTTACAAVYRRSMLMELGGFDEAYSPFYWEDADLGYRAWKRGWKSLYQPAGTAYHQHAASISKMDSSYIARIKARNGFFFIWRNIEDKGLLACHRKWLPYIILRRMLFGDRAYTTGWRDAYSRRAEAVAARDADSRSRVLSDREIFEIVGID